MEALLYAKANRENCKKKPNHLTDDVNVTLFQTSNMLINAYSVLELFFPSGAFFFYYINCTIK